MVKQDDPRMPEAFRRWGCRARCLMAIPEFVSRKELEAGQILTIIEEGEQHPDVFASAQYKTGKAEHWLINRAFMALGSNRRGAQIGIMMNEDPQYWAWARRQGLVWTYMIREHETDNGVHFVTCDRRPVEIFDPYGGPYNKGPVLRELLYDTWLPG